MIALALLACHGADDTDTTNAIAWAAPDAQGPFAAGVTTREYTDDRGKSMKIEVWYPADPVDGDSPDPYPEFPIVGTAYRDAPADHSGGAWPLVAFSHGNDGIRWQSIFLTEWLAQHGFVVVAPDHNLDTFLDFDENALVDVMLERPGDIESAVDHLIGTTDDPLLGGLADGSQYAMLGHSFGAWTTLAVAGGAFDTAGFNAHCANHPDTLCSLAGHIPADAVLPEPDPRAVVAIPMAPCGYYAFGANGEALSELAPSLFLGGGKDDICPMDSEVQPAFDAAGAPKSEGVLPLSGHFSFSDACSWAPTLTDECDEQAAGFGVIADEQAAIRTVVTAFIATQLSGDDRDAPWLADQLPADFDWTAP